LNPGAIAVALLAAIAFGASTALMHHSASRAPKGEGGATGLARLILHLLREPWWLAGMAASLIGLGLHTVALGLGSLAVVQPLVVTGLVFAFIFRAALDRHLPSRPLMIWVFVTACGIAVFLFGAHSSSGSAHLSGTAAGFFLGVCAGLSGLAWWLSGRVRPHYAGVLLGLSAGLIFGLIAGMLKSVTAATSLESALTSWPIYVLVGLGATGFLINQHAYSRAPLASSLPVLNVINPVVAVIFGVVVFHERPSSEPLLLVFELIGLILVLTGVSFLARSEDQIEAPRTPPSPPQPVPSPRKTPGRSPSAR
jgi:drug/metabolite transporter (DMT)-like permease